ncbi:MAG TPA: competence/damage-inducible protein A [Enterococcus sp.]|nr:competence/damage-inducible protein A [Enterococcus sp.]
MKAEIIAVGTELLLGQVVNTNATFLSEELAGLGIDVYYHSVVGDNPERLESLLALADQRSELIVLCGGLGPTEDDLTKQVTAAHVGQELIRDELGYQKLLSFFEKRQRPMTENNLLQTLIFKDGISLQNSTGLAVGIFYTSDKGNHYLLLPGPPNELKPMFYNEVVPLLKEKFQKKDQLISRVLRFYGIGESQLVTDLADLIQGQTNPTIAPYAKPNEVTLRLTVKTTDEAQGLAQLDDLEKIIQERVGEFFYGYGGENSLANVVVELLKKNQQTLTAAESLTAGAFQATLGDISGVSEVFPGGFVTYSAETKANFLGIEKEFLEQVGTVSQECVEQMAINARKLAQTDYAVAFSGVAGPNELEGQPAGTVWIALASEQGIHSQNYHFTRDRSYIRHSAVMTGLDLVRRALLNR